MRYLIKFSYDGSSFNGFQRQGKLKTVQYEIEKALSTLEGKKVNIYGASRTDKGVHANEQCAHFNLNVNIKSYGLKKYLNRILNGEIYIKEVLEINDDFHARYNVKRKVYSYYINIGTYNPCMRNYQFQYNLPLDIEAMKKSSLSLIGKHDFRAFCMNQKEKDNCVREIYNIDFEINNDILKIAFIGNGFLRKMIRNIVGILILIGSSKKDINYLKEVLDSKTRKGNMKSVPGCGLYLEKIDY